MPSSAKSSVGYHPHPHPHQHSRSISFSDDVVGRGASDREQLRASSSQLSSSPQQEQQNLNQHQQQRRLSEDAPQPAPPRGILTNKDGHYRGSYRTPLGGLGGGGAQQNNGSLSSLSRSLPYRKQQQQQQQQSSLLSQRHSPPLPPSPLDCGLSSTSESRHAEEDVYGTSRGAKAVNFAVGNSFEMTPRRSGSASRVDVEGSSSPTRGSWRGAGLRVEEEEEEEDDLNTTTTTSGSYTVGEGDDFRRAGDDNLFFNDVVV